LAPCGLDKNWKKYNMLFPVFIKEVIWVKRSIAAYPLSGAVPGQGSIILFFCHSVLDSVHLLRINPGMISFVSFFFKSTLDHDFFRCKIVWNEKHIIEEYQELEIISLLSLFFLIQKGQ